MQRIASAFSALVIIGEDRPEGASNARSDNVEMEVVQLGSRLFGFAPDAFHRELWRVFPKDWLQITSSPKSESPLL
jgi:hypothetical protein